MREIKFRAWDKESKYMITSLQSIANIVKKFILGFPEKGLDGEGGDYPNGHVTGNDYLLMQYTGLQDKNGKEIYEGDICTFYWNPIFNEPSTLFELIAPVIWYEKWTAFCFEIKKSASKGKQLELFNEDGLEEVDALYVAVGSPISYGTEMTGKRESGTVKIIGNIYENLELLKE